MDSSNFRNRVLPRLAEELKLPKLTFQVIRRTIATLAQKKGGVKDIQGMLCNCRGFGPTVKVLPQRCNRPPRIFTCKRFRGASRR